MNRVLILVGMLGALSVVSRAGSPERFAPRPNPTARQIVDEVSETRIVADLKKLESFETRNTLSEANHPTHGIGTAREWIFQQFKSYSPKLEVSFDTHQIPRGGRITREVELRNVVAVLPGRTAPERRIVIGGHYDTVNLRDRSPDAPAPGVCDDGSGTATVMELARVMSKHEFDKTLVFVAFAGEEQGLIGSTRYARKARAENHLIEAVLNNDIIGTDAGGNGVKLDRNVRVFSEDPADSLSRQVARYVRRIGNAYVPTMTVDLIFRHDRFGRGGDHTPFNQEGYAAVRVTSAAEHYAHQHTATDTLANCSPSYITRVAKINAAAAASLALAPKPPSVTTERGAPTLGRGRSGYAAQLRWRNDKPETDLAGYVVVMRSTTAPDWEREIPVGNVTEHVIEDVSIDAWTLGVKALDGDGNESLVSAYVNPPRQRVSTDGS